MPTKCFFGGEEDGRLDGWMRHLQDFKSIRRAIQWLKKKSRRVQAVRVETTQGLHLGHRGRSDWAIVGC